LKEICVISVFLSGKFKETHGAEYFEIKGFSKT
jgi:hypothetical protein